MSLRILGAPINTFQGFMERVAQHYLRPLTKPNDCRGFVGTWLKQNPLTEQQANALWIIVVGHENDPGSLPTPVHVLIVDGQARRVADAYTTGRFAKGLYYHPDHLETPMPVLGSIKVSDFFKRYT